MTNQIRVNGITYTSPEFLPESWAVSTVKWNGYKIAIHADSEGMLWFDALLLDDTHAKFVGIEFAEEFATVQTQVDESLAITRPDGFTQPFRLSLTLSSLCSLGFIDNFTPVQF